MLANNGAHGTPNGVRAVNLATMNMELLTEFMPKNSECPKSSPRLRGDEGEGRLRRDISKSATRNPRIAN